jgi:hypothetical protein
MPETEWMQKGLEKQGEARLRAELRSAKERLAEMCLERFEAEFLSDLLRWLRHFSKKLADIGMEGRIAETSTPREGPQIYQVSVRNGPPFFRSTYSTIQFNVPKVRLITCHAVEGTDRNINLAPLPTMDGIGAIWPDRMMPLSAEETASEIVREIVNRVDSTGW